MAKNKRFQRKQKVSRTRSTFKQNRALDMYDTKGYYKDLEYIARLSYIQESTRQWIEASMYELRSSANIYEHNFGELLINNGIDFIHQAPFVFRPKTIYFCDFYLPKQRIAIEIDGIYHNADAQSAKDAERDNNFKSIGIRVIRIHNEETKDKERLLLRLHEYLFPRPKSNKPQRLSLLTLVAMQAPTTLQTVC